MSADAIGKAEAERLLDDLATELLDQGLMEFVEFFMPHRQDRTSPPTASEIYGIRFDEEAGGFRVWHRDMGVTRVLMEAGSWHEARALYVEKVAAQSDYLRGRS